MYAMRAFCEEEGETLEDDDIPDADILTSGCGGLIAVDKESRLVRLVHYTAQEYFQREHQDRLPDTRTEITRICLAYLRLPNFSDGISTEDAAMSTRLEQYPFLDDNIEVVRMLVEAGVSLSEENSWQDSALSVATRNGQEAIATYLADSGAILPNSRAGRRASVIAVRKGLPQLARRLTNEYAAVARRGLERQSPAREGDLIDIPEDQEESSIGGGSSMRSTDQEVRPYDLSEALDGVNYNRGFLRRYDHVELLAKGHFAQVFLSRNKVTGVLYAVKILSPKQKGVVESIRNEIDSLTELHHQHIIHLVDIMVQDTMDTVYLVLELATEGELFNWVVMKQKLTESETRKVFSQIFSALAFMVSLSKSYLR
ncbi:serine/threonine protein kinase [Neofusicoccum ribis]|uniref:Serine/threonine protein kinase n=1 Tax=Neofusicoccum ribis TaxID=45134 RepID=A0ABR3T7H6_9PEZI